MWNPESKLLLSGKLSKCDGSPFKSRSCYRISSTTPREGLPCRLHIKGQRPRLLFPNHLDLWQFALMRTPRTLECCARVWPLCPRTLGFPGPKVESLSIRKSGQQGLPIYRRALYEALKLRRGSCPNSARPRLALRRCLACKCGGTCIEHISTARQLSLTCSG